MVLTIDIGNTQITMGVFRNSDISFVSRLSTDKSKTYDQYAAEIKGIFDINHVDTLQITGAIICSVVPHLTTNLKHVVKSICGIDAITIENDEDIDISVKNIAKGQLGGDLAVGAFAAISLYSYPSIVVDIGTATSLLVIDDKGTVCGGTISPGPAISLKALTKYCDLIPGIDLKAPENIISGNSAAALRSGILTGTAAMIDGMYKRIVDEFGYEFKLIITGGPSSLIAPLCFQNYTLDENLLLKGLFELFHLKK